jgi:hypothetical protein
MLADPDIKLILRSMERLFFVPNITKSGYQGILFIDVSFIVQKSLIEVYRNNYQHQAHYT